MNEDGEEEYLLKGEGYEESQNSWEPIRNLILDLIKDYENEESRNKENEPRHIPSQVGESSKASAVKERAPPTSLPHRQAAINTRKGQSAFYSNSKRFNTEKQVKYKKKNSPVCLEIRVFNKRIFKNREHFFRLYNSRLLTTRPESRMRLLLGQFASSSRLAPSAKLSLLFCDIRFIVLRVCWKGGVGAITAFGNSPTRHTRTGRTVRLAIVQECALISLSALFPFRRSKLKAKMRV